MPQQFEGFLNPEIFWFYEYINLSGSFFAQFYKSHMVCFEFEISQVDVDNLETGFQSWVIDYERCIFLFLLYHYMI